jgi:hypothetical protein
VSRIAAAPLACQLGQSDARNDANRLPAAAGGLLVSRSAGRISIQHSI